MEANIPKRKEPGKSLRIKVISMGNAEVGKVSIPRWEGRDHSAAERRGDWLGRRPLNSLGPSLLPAPEQAWVSWGMGLGGESSPNLFDLWVAQFRHLYHVVSGESLHSQVLMSCVKRTSYLFSSS